MQNANLVTWEQELNLTSGQQMFRQFWYSINVTVEHESWFTNQSRAGTAIVFCEGLAVTGKACEKYVDKRMFKSSYAYTGCI